MLKRLRAALDNSRARRAYETRARAGFSIVKISFPERIGHLCCEIDCLLKETILDGQAGRQFLLPDIGERFANRHIVDYYRRHLTVASDPDLIRYMAKPTGDTAAIVETHPYAVAMYATAKAYEVCARWGDRPPLFDLTAQDREALERYLRAAGVPQDAWFVCLHAREGGYSPIDEAIHKFRSIQVSSYTQAVEAIAARGGWIIRLGDKTMTPYAPHPRVVDYASGPHKSARLDVALTAGCRFLLGSASGMLGLAAMFGVPCVTANMAPLGASYGLASCDISIPQKLRDRDGRLMGLQEIMEGPSSHYRLNEEFIAHGLVNEPNSAEEILEATVEMMDRLDGTAVYTDADHARQDAFRALFQPGHYTYKAGALIGRDFLRRYMPA